MMKKYILVKAKAYFDSENERYAIADINGNVFMFDGSFTAIKLDGLLPLTIKPCHFEGNDIVKIKVNASDCCSLCNDYSRATVLEHSGVMYIAFRMPDCSFYLFNIETGEVTDMVKTLCSEWRDETVTFLGAVPKIIW